MTRTVEAVYENGVFRPLQPVELAEGQRVQVTLPLPPAGPISPEKARELLREAQQVYEGLTDEEIAEIESCFTPRNKD
jgi:predicted DNA-binding antitoxin AbrB/MazE fold protein